MEVVDTPRTPDTVYVVDNRELERRVAGLELRLLERQAQIQELEARIDVILRDLVRSMARNQALATRAEAASAIAEATMVVEELRAAFAGAAAPAVDEAQMLVDMSAAEFDGGNYGGAVYIAAQVRIMAGTTGAPAAGALREGEVPFAAPIALEVGRDSNVREGPGTAFAALFVLTAGSRVTGSSYLNDWVRVTDEQGRSGWIFYELLANRR
jgi:hypothetical protein